MADSIVYRDNEPIDTATFADVLRRSTLGLRRPVDDLECMQGMVEHADITTTAWAGDLCIGVSRTVTDFHYAAYLSDLAVDEDWQGKGIGLELIQRLRDQVGPKCNIILLAAPAAEQYYPRIGFQHRPQGWVLRPSDPFPPS